MYKRKEMLQRAGLVILLVVALFVNGCTPQPTDTEIYISEFVLHDINDTTPKVLESPAEKYGSYSFDYNMPGSAPEIYSSIWFFFSPGQGIAGSLIYPVASGNKQILYAYESNPVSENYKINLSLSRKISLSYFKANSYFEENAYRDFRKEFLSGGDVYNYVNLKSNEQKEYSFGGSYTPGSIVVENSGYTHLRGELLSGKNTHVDINTNISICTKAIMSDGWISCKQRVGKQIDAPHFEIYEDGIIVQGGNLTQNYYSQLIWATWPLSYYSQENKNYIVNITIPSHTQTFAKSIVTAEFSTKGEDKSPPWITELKANAGFDDGTDLKISFNAQDDQDLASIKVFSRADDGEWLESQENLNPSIIAGAKPIKVNIDIPTKGDKIDLRIELKDNTGNSQRYTILPISLNKKGHELKFEVHKDKEVISPGTIVNLYGKITDLAENGISNLFISAFYNGKEVARAYTQKGYWDFGEDIEPGQFYVDNDGNFSFLFKTPLDYTSDANLSIITKETGLYKQKEYIINGFGQIFDKDVAVLDISAPGYLTLGDNEINVTVANVGKSEATVQLDILQSGINDYGVEIGQRTLLKSVEVSLQPQETRTISLIIQPQVSDNSLMQKIIASAVLEGDNNAGNNEQSAIRQVFVQTDASVSINTANRWIVNETNTIKVIIKNEGTTDLTDINYTLKVLNEDKGLSAAKWRVVASGTIESLKSREQIVKKIPLKFSSEGDFQLRGEIQAEGDLNPNNDIHYNFVEVRENGADIRSYFWFQSENLILNQKNNITISTWNEGTEAAKDVNISLYIAKGYCDIYKAPLNSCRDVRLLYSNYSDSLDANKEIENKIEFTPTEKGEFSFVLIANASNDVNLQNNLMLADTYVKNSGADLQGWISTDERAIVGQIMNITINIENTGNEKTIGGTLQLFARNASIASRCVEGEKCQLPAPPTQLMKKDIEVSAGEKITEVFKYTPIGEGYLQFIAVLNASNEAEQSNNVVEKSLMVLKKGADMAVYIDNMEYDGFATKDKPTEFAANLVNEGTENATNVKYAIYAREINKNGVANEKNTGYGIEKENYKLITTGSFARAIKPQERMPITLTYTPKKKGGVNFMVNVSANEDTNFENNQNYFSRVVKNNERDAAIDYVTNYKILKKGQPGQILVYLNNVGNERLEGVNVSLIVNGQLIEKKSVDLPLGAREWEGQKKILFDYTPNSIGLFNITVLAFAAGEKDLSDNKYENEISIYEVVLVNVSIADSKRNAVNRFLISLSKEKFINDTLPTQIEFYNDGGENSMIKIAAASFRNEEETRWQTDAYFQSISFVGLKSLAASEEIISERYDNITQNGILYYSVFANKPMFNYTKFNFVTAMMKGYAEKIGMNSSKLEGYTLFYCTQFDFNLKQCASQWNKINKNIINQGTEGKEEIFYSETKTDIKSKIEAFALSKMPILPSVRANLGSSDIMNNFILEDNESAYGKIEFKDAVDVSRIRATSSLLQDYVVFDNKKVFIDTDNLNELKEKSARVTIKNIAMRNPQIYYNGALCPSSVCSNKNYNSTGKFITFDVSGFSSFEIVEGAYCGDKICQSGNNENCNSCPSDCGVCITQISGERECIPRWNCTWGACVNNARKEICTDLRNCRINFNKPTERTELCLKNSKDCIDNDKDGYGIGADCLGRDINDNDPTVTTAPRTQEINNLNNRSVNSNSAATAGSKNEGNFIYYIIGIFALAILIVFVLILVAYNRNKSTLQPAYSDRENSTRINSDSVKNAAKDWVKENRAKGYSNEEMIKNLKKQGWSNEDINWLTKK